MFGFVYFHSTALNICFVNGISFFNSYRLFESQSIHFRALKYSFIYYSNYLGDSIIYVGTELVEVALPKQEPELPKQEPAEAMHNNSGLHFVYHRMFLFIAKEKKGISSNEHVQIEIQLVKIPCNVKKKPSLFS